MAYPGGKGGPGVAQRIINQMPPHEVYIEPFLGGGAVMRMKRPAAENVGLDLDPDVIAAWRPMEGVVVVVQDGLHYLKFSAFRAPALVYCDPPYPIGSRRHPRQIYRYEMSDNDHRRLIAILRALPFMVMVSSYCSDLYGEALSDWRLTTFRATTRSGALAVEHLWCNFPPPTALHDYRFLGRNYRERERINRRVRRWRSRLNTLPPLERQAILSALTQ